MDIHPPQESSKSSRRLTIWLEIEAEEGEKGEDADIGDIIAANNVGRDTIEALREEGYTVNLPTGATRGGPEILVEVVTTVSNVVANAWEHKEIYERVLADASALVGICGGIVPVVKWLFQAHKKRAGNEEAPMKITVDIDELSVVVEAADMELAEEAAIKLANQLYISNPAAAAKVTAKSKTRIKGHLPRKARRKRR